MSEKSKAKSAAKPAKKAAKKPAKKAPTPSSNSSLEALEQQVKALSSAKPQGEGRAAWKKKLRGLALELSARQKAGSK